MIAEAGPVPYDALDPPIRALCRALNAFPGVQTTGKEPGERDDSTLVEITWAQSCAQCHGPYGRGDGPQGPMQVGAVAAFDVGGGDRFDLQQNRRLGRAYLAQMFLRYGNWPDALAACKQAVPHRFVKGRRWAIFCRNDGVEETVDILSFLLEVGRDVHTIAQVSKGLKRVSTHQIVPLGRAKGLYGMAAKSRSKEISPPPCGNTASWVFASGSKSL